MYGEITSYKVFDSACSTVSAASPETNGFDPEEPYTRTSGERDLKGIEMELPVIPSPYQINSLKIYHLNPGTYIGIGQAIQGGPMFKDLRVRLQ